MPSAVEVTRGLADWLNGRKPRSWRWGGRENESDAMIKRLEGLPREVFGFEAAGRLTSAELDEVMNAFDATIRDGYDITLLIEYHSGLSEGPGVDKSRFNYLLSTRGRTQRFAFVGDHKWQAAFDDFVEFVGCDARMFSPGKRDAAIAWLLEAPFLKVENDAS